MDLKTTAWLTEKNVFSGQKCNFLVPPLLPPTVGMPHILGKVHTLNMSKGKTKHSRLIHPQTCLLEPFLNSLQEQLRPRDYTLAQLSQLVIWIGFHTFSVASPFPSFGLILGPNIAMQRTGMTVPSRVLLDYVHFFQCLNVQNAKEVSF